MCMVEEQLANDESTMPRPWRNPVLEFFLELVDDNTRGGDQ